MEFSQYAAGLPLVETPVVNWFHNDLYALNAGAIASGRWPILPFMPIIVPRLKVRSRFTASPSSLLIVGNLGLNKQQLEAMAMQDAGSALGLI